MSSQYETVAVLIDQIDALSQTLSSQRDAMNTYQLLIESIKSIENLRIVLSVRTFDLNYDPDLQSYKNQKVISASLLNNEEVGHVLQQLGVDLTALSLPLKAILQIPNYLNVFCKIFRPGVAPTFIKTTRDLYEELWRQTLTVVEIGSTISAATIKQCLQELAQTMNDRQQIYVSHYSFFDRYVREIDYLSSTGLLINDGKIIQFFHQTFYDFVFALSFVEAGRSVKEYVLSNENSLHIRSGLKMILGFLREENNVEFVQSVKIMLVSSKYFFHIKFLVYNLLGFIEEPTLAELELVQQTILPNQKRTQLYLESVYSDKQLNFLIEMHVLEKLLLKKPNFIQRLGTSRVVKRFDIEERLSKILNYSPFAASKAVEEQLCFSLLAKHLPLSRATILPFLLHVSDFSRKGAFVFRLLYFLKNWDQEEALLLFEKYKQEGFADTFQFYHILIDIVPVHPLWVISIYKPLLLSEADENSQLGKMSHDNYLEGQLFEKLFLVDPVSAYEFAWEVVDKFIHSSAHFHPFQKEVLLDHHFLMFTYERAEREQETHHRLYTFLIETLTNFLITDQERFTEYCQRIMQSGKLSFIRMLPYAFQNQETILESTKNLFYIFFVDAATRNLLPLDDKLKYQLCRTLRQYFPFFSVLQKDKVVAIILTIKDPFELQKYSSAEKVDFARNEGNTIYKYLTALPKDFVTSDTHTKKRFAELERKYGAVDESEPYLIRMYGVGAPLKKSAYDNMGFDQWLNSFKRYNTDNHNDRKHPSKGGLTENYRAFKEKVKERPYYFLPFVKRLFNEDVHQSYLTAALEGLKEANIPKQEFFHLYKLAIRQKLGRFETLQLVWLLSYLLEDEIVDEEIVDFLIQLALYHPDPEKDRGQPRHESINTVRGAAVEKLTMIFFNEEWKEKILLALEQASNDSQISVRVSLISRLAYLMNLAPNQAFNIFVKLTQCHNPEIYAASIFSATYLINYSFERLRPYFDNFINHPSGSEDIASILAVAYLDGKPGSEKLVQKAFRVNDKLRKNILHIAWTYILNDAGNVDSRAARMFMMGRQLTSEMVLHEYSIAFLKWSPTDFLKLYSLIYEYSRSKAGKHVLHHYYEYLLKCAKAEPEKCLQLISNMRSHAEAPPAKRIGEEQAIYLVIGIYNQLVKISRKQKQAQKALKLFDYLLQNPLYRRNANKVTDEVER